MKKEKETQANKDWEKCVKRAKRSLGIPTDKYMMLSGAVLKRAMLAYCAMGY